MAAATYVLIRHAQTDFTGNVLLGRMPGIGLNARGHNEASNLAARLEPLPLVAIYSSPQERAFQTAQPIAVSKTMEIGPTPAFQELDCGDWTGVAFEKLQSDPHWLRFNSFRSSTRIPNGEHIADVQMRAVDQLEAWRTAHDGQTIAVVSHADVIRAVLCHYLGMPVDLMLRLEIQPASISILKLHEWGPSICAINAYGEAINAFGILAS
jgi:probable phosphomutase (TIGR03848 family)